jgi:zinc D-Ala-D-Ala carboxypeptidase
MHKYPMKLLYLLTITPLFIILCCGQGRQKVTTQDTASQSSPGQEIISDNDTLPADSLATKEYLLGRFNPGKHPKFRRIETPYTSMSEGYLRKEALDAFETMHIAARKEGISLKIVSATRNFSAQKGIWEAKWDGARKVEGVDLTTVNDPIERASIILKFSSMPGTSRHHWGTDIDINSVDPAYFLTAKGIREYRWLADNAHKYGFCQTYTLKDSLRPTGYEEEPWHWSYTPVSGHLLKRYLEIITYEDIQGFKGDQAAEPLRVIRDYVKGINRNCQ